MPSRWDGLRGLFVVALCALQGGPPLPPSRPDALHARRFRGDSIQPKQHRVVKSSSGEILLTRENHLYHKLVTVTRTLTKMKMKKSTKSGLSRPGNRWRLQDAKARLSELVRQAQQRGPQRVTLHGRDAVVVVRADEFDRMRRPISGRDIVAALATSPLADVNFERMTIKSPIRDVNL